MGLSDSEEEIVVSIKVIELIEGIPASKLSFCMDLDSDSENPLERLFSFQHTFSLLSKQYES